MPAYNTIPPSLISVPRPGTTVVEKPFAVTTRTGRSTATRGHRRVLGEFGTDANHSPLSNSLQITKVQEGSRSPVPAVDYRGVLGL